MFYDSQISYHRDLRDSVDALFFEEWALEYLQGTLKPSGVLAGDPTQPPIQKVLPVMFGIPGAYTFKEPRGTSRGNSYNIHFGIRSMLHLLQFATLNKFPMESSRFLVIVPYIKQAQMWTEALTNHPTLEVVKVWTTYSIQGMEGDFVRYDLTAG